MFMTTTRRQFFATLFAAPLALAAHLKAKPAIRGYPRYLGHSCDPIIFATLPPIDREYWQTLVDRFGEPCAVNTYEHR